MTLFGTLKYEVPFLFGDRDSLPVREAAEQVSVPFFGGHAHGKWLPVQSRERRMLFPAKVAMPAMPTRSAQAEFNTEDYEILTLYARTAIVYREFRIALLVGYRPSWKESFAIRDLLHMSPIRLRPAPSIIHDFDAWFRWACYKHRATAEIVAEVDMELSAVPMLAIDLQRSR